MTEKLFADYLKAEALAQELGISVRTLYRWNALGFGPPKTKIGNTVFYHIDAARKWLKDNERGPVRERRR